MSIALDLMESLLAAPELGDACISDAAALHMLVAWDLAERLLVLAALSGESTLEAAGLYMPPYTSRSRCSLPRRSVAQAPWTLLCSACCQSPSWSCCSRWKCSVSRASRNLPRSTCWLPWTSRNRCWPPRGSVPYAICWTAWQSCCSPRSSVAPSPFDVRCSACWSALAELMLAAAELGIGFLAR